MPHSPFTRILAVVIVVLSAAVLLCPWVLSPLAGISPWVGFLLSGILMVSPVVFTWTTALQCSPFNERAFHLTLPDGRSRAFRRVLGLHAMVFVAISLCLIAYAAISNSRWPDAVHAVLAFLLVLTAVCGAVGTAVTLGTASRKRGITALVLAVLLGVGSCYLLDWVHRRDGFGWSWPRGSYYLSGTRCAVLIAALGYSFTWWWAVMRRNKTGSLLGVVLIGISLPWIGTHANFVPVPEADAQAPTFALAATRKAVPDTTTKWAKITDMLELSGLEEGEFSTISALELAEERGRLQACGFQEVRKGISPQERDLGEKNVWQQRNTWFGKSGGRIVWGSQDLWKHLEGQLPPHETVKYFADFGWRSAGEWPETDLICFTAPDRRNWMGSGTESTLSGATWKLSLSGAVRWEIVGSCKLASGASFRPPQGGVLSVLPLEERNGNAVIRIAFRAPAFGPVFHWFGGKPEFADPGKLRLMLLDEAGSRAYVLGELSPEDARNPSPSGSGTSPSTWWWAGRDSENVLRRGTLYLFQPRASRYHEASLELPPP